VFTTLRLSPPFFSLYDTEQAALRSYRPLVISPSVLAWGDGTVRRIAEGIAADGALGRLPILADAGCDDEALIAHCRSHPPGVRACWVIDLLLGRP
jgi:hypothetical protein